METARIRKRSWKAYGLAIAFTALAALLRLTLPGVMQQTPFLVFYPAVALSAVLGGFRAGILATFAASLCYALWFHPTPDRFGFFDLIRLSIFVAAGAAVSFLAYVQRRREGALGESESRFRSLFANMPNGYAYCKMEYDDAGRPVDFVYLQVNKAFEELTGLKDVVGKRVTEVIPGVRDVEPGIIEIYGRVAATGRSERFEIDFTPLNMWLDVTVYSTQKGCFVAVFDNITERKRAEDALKALNLTLEERVAERTALAEHRAAQLRELASRMSQTEQQERRRVAHILHEHFQQLLVAAELQLTRLKGGRSQKELTGIADEIANILAAGIDASRTLAVELCPPILYQMGLVPALKWLAMSMQDKYGLEVEVTADAAAEPGTEAVRMLLFESASELLFNIVKHAGVKAAHVGIKRSGDQIELTIIDKGAGFNPSRLPAGANASDGFGLFSVRERLDLMGGRLKIDSVLGQGTFCSISIPIETKAPASEAPPVAVVATISNATGMEVNGADRGAQRKIRVILVDDHAIVRNGIALAVKRAPDMEIAGEASDGHAAVELVREIVPDVVLMDVSMPGMDGIEATRLIHQELPGVSIIGLSMFEESEQSAAMQRAGACAYLTKSGDLEALLAAVRRWRPPLHASRWPLS